MVFEKRRGYLDEARKTIFIKAFLQDDFHGFLERVRSDRPLFSV